MTSIPASRRARAITLAPRSWPSRPGLAMRTRIFFSDMRWEGYFKIWGLGNGDFLIDAEGLAEGVADIPERGVGFHGFEEMRHQVFGAVGGVAQGIEAALDFAVGAFCAQFAEPGSLASLD